MLIVFSQSIDNINEQLKPRAMFALVKGENILASVLKDVVSMLEDIDLETECFPKPIVMPDEYYIGLGLLCGLLLVLTLFDYVIIRLQQRTLGLFFPEIAKFKALNLHQRIEANRVLKRMFQIFVSGKHSKEVKLFDSLYIRYGMFRFLAQFLFGIYKVQCG